MNDRHERLRASIHRLQDKRASLDVAPRSAYELVTREKLDELVRDMEQLRGRVDALIWAVVVAVVVQIAMQLIGGR